MARNLWQAQKMQGAEPLPLPQGFEVIRVLLGVLGGVPVTLGLYTKVVEEMASSEYPRWLLLVTSQNLYKK